MHHKKLGFVIGILAVVALIVGISLNTQPLWGQTKEVRIAVNLPLSGDLATYGASVREGATMALEDLGKDGTASKLRFDWQDNAGDPKTTVTVFQKQYLEPPDMYVSGVKPQTMAIIDRVTAKGTPHFVWIFDIAINRNSKNNFRTWVSFKLEAPVFLEYAGKQKPKRVAITYVQLPHTTEEYNDVVVPGLRKQGITEIYVEPYDLSRSEFKDLAVKINEFKPDLIIMNGFQAQLVALVRAMRPLGLIKNGNTIGAYDMLDAAKVLGPDEVEGIRVVAPVFTTRPSRDEVKRWRERFEAKYGKAPLYTHAYGYDMVIIMNDAAKRVQHPATPEQWIGALRSTDLKGITGPLKFDEGGDLLTPVEVGLYRNGKLVPDGE
jgi:branched-chain amino acid transport system substrate-binding protein